MVHRSSDGALEIEQGKISRLRVRCSCETPDDGDWESGIGNKMLLAKKNAENLHRRKTGFEEIIALCVCASKLEIVPTIIGLVLRDILKKTV